MGLALLTAGYIATGALSVAVLMRSGQPLLAFPVLITVWVAYLWVFVAQAIETLSSRPHRLRRITTIVVACCCVAIVALAASIVVGITCSPEP